ncbi:MAG: DUF2282 domain-containing protein [Planctomycetia bacterium]|nr:DUF2282 domain-containing protein [Planctomycetia bacterium]
MTKISAIAVASVVAGALALAGTAVAQTQGASGFKCYGISKAGQNDCANAAKTHDCAGQSKTDYHLGEWKAVKDAAECAKLSGVDKPGKGVNPKAPKA